MTVWRHSISWSKFKLALDCPLSLQFTIDKKSHGRPTSTFYTALGKLSQLVFELYYNQKVNLKPGGQEESVILRATERVLNQKTIDALQISYPHNKTEDDLKQAVRDQVTGGFRIMKDIGLTKLEVRSEVKMIGVFRGFRMFALVDFLREGTSGDFIFDGKGHAKKNADPRQVVYYALNRASSGRKIAGGGMIYWNHGFEKVDVSPAALRHFVDTDFTRVRPYFEMLDKGSEGPFPATPSAEKCKVCPWRNTCEFSMAKNPPQQFGVPTEIGFGEARPEV